MAKYPGLVRRENIWYIRKRVPQDIADLFKSDSVKRSLGTENLGEAKQLYHIQMLKLESEFDEKRKNKLHVQEADQLSKFSEAALLGLAFKWYQETEGRNRQIEQKNPKSYSADELHEAYIEACGEKDILHQSLMSNDYEVIYPAAQQWLQRREISYDVGSQAYHLFCQYMLKASIFSLENTLREHKGKTIIHDIPAFFEPVRYQSAPAPGEQTIPITELLEQFINQAERKDIPEKNHSRYRAIIRRMIDFAGRELYVHEINRAFLVDYRDALMRYPSQAHVLPECKGKTFNEIIKLTEGMDIPRMNVKTINGHMASLHTLFEFAALNEYIQKNPVKKLALKDTVKKKDKKSPWPIQDLIRIFQMPEMYPKASGKPKTGKYDETLRWVCLIALWSGLRLNEACQLHTEDLREYDGILYLDIVERPQEGSTVKTASSIRAVPVHRELIKCGLPEYVEEQRKKKSSWLFSGLPLNAKYGRGHYISKRFKILLAKHGIDTPKCSFHSFRHNYRDALRNAEVSTEVALALGGWSSGQKQNVGDNYGSGYSLQVKNENLQKISYPGLDLSGFYIASSKE